MALGADDLIPTLQLVKAHHLAAPGRFIDPEQDLHGAEVVPAAADRFLAGLAAVHEMDHLVDVGIVAVKAGRRFDRHERTCAVAGIMGRRGDECGGLVLFEGVAFHHGGVDAAFVSQQHKLEQPGRPGGPAVGNVRDGTALEFDCRHGAILGAASKHRVISPAGAEDTRRISQEEAQQVNEVHGLPDHGAAARPGAIPAPGGSVAARGRASSHHPRHPGIRTGTPDCAQFARIDKCLDAHVAGHMTQLLADHQRHTGFVGSSDNVSALGETDGHGLFQQHVPAGLGRGNCEIPVDMVTGTDVDRVKVRIGQHAGGIRVYGIDMCPAREAPNGFFVHIAHGGEL